MPEPVATPADQVAAAAAAAPVEGKPAEAVADAAQDQEDGTLLGEQKKEEKPVAIPDAKVIPEKYEFKVPEGMTLDTAAVEKFSPVFKELGLDQKGAQKLVDAYVPYLQEQIKGQLEAQQQAANKVFNDMKTEWKNETIKELGADHAKELAVAAKFIDRFGTPKLREVLNETGLGNHPEIVRAFIKAGKAISEDSFADSNIRKQDNSDEAKAKRLFPNTAK